MKRLKIYIAGPDVFSANANDIYRSYENLCKQRGFECLYPNDSVIEPADTSEGFAANIFKANQKMMDQADIVIANVDPFRGPSMDVGTAFEIGYAAALGKPVFGFCSQPMPLYFERLNQYYGEIVPDELGYRAKADATLLENFGLSDNLMIAHGISKRVYPGFEAALEAVAKYSLGCGGFNAHYAMEKDFPIWLKTFDHANDQHKVSMQRLNYFVDGLKQKMPNSWRMRDHLSVLDLACGDGRFSRRVVDLIEKKLGLKVDYSAIELNSDFVSEARLRFPEGRIDTGNIFEHLPEYGDTNKPDLILLSHAIYFAQDIKAYAERLARLGGTDTLTLYLLNDPIYRPVHKYIDQLVEGLSQAGLPFTASNPFKSHVSFPADAQEHLTMLLECAEGPDARQESATTRNLLSFFQQSRLDDLEVHARNDYLHRVQRDLLLHGGKIPFYNHCVVATHYDASLGIREMAEWAVKYMDVVSGLKCVLEEPALTIA